MENKSWMKGRSLQEKTKFAAKLLKKQAFSLLISIFYPPRIVYFLLAVLIMGPMLGPGFVLTLDMTFTPTLPAPNEASNTYFFKWFLYIVNIIIPGEIIQKILIFTILLASGLGAHRLLDESLKIKRETRKKKIKSSIGQKNSSYQISGSQLLIFKIPAYLAGVFYMVNPFTYERWMAGHYLVLAGYALIPFLLKTLIDFSNKPNKKSAIHIALWITAIGLVSIHLFVLAIILATIFITPKLTKPKNLKFASVTIVVIIVLNFYWILATITSPLISKTIDSIGQADFQAFASSGDNALEIFINVVTLYGFWLEDDGRFAISNSNLFCG